MRVTLAFFMWCLCDSVARAAEVMPPRPRQAIEIAYPREAALAGAEGDVTVLITLDERGTVQGVELTSPPLGSGLDDAVIEAARRFEFDPARIDGVPTAVRLPFTWRFRLPAPEPVAATPASPGAAPEARAAPETEPAPASDAPPTDGGEIVVRGARPPASLARRTLDGELLRTVPGSFGDPIRAVQNLPGIHRPSTVRGTIVVRGTSPRDTSVFVDGHEIPQVYHFFNGPSVLPPEMLDRIDFYPGNYSVRYGRSLGGIIDVGLRRGDDLGWRGSVDVDLFDAGGFVEGPVTEDWTIAVAGRRSYVDAVMVAADALVKEKIATISPSYWDYQTRSDLRMRGGHRLTVTGFGSQDSIEVNEEGGGRNDDDDGDAGARVAFHRLKLEWRATPSDDLEWMLSPILGVDLRSADRGESQVDEQVLAYGLRFDSRYTATEAATVSGGLDVQGRSVRLTAEQRRRVVDYRRYPGGGGRGGEPETERLERRYEFVSPAAWVEGEGRAGGFTLIPGLRLDTYVWHGRLRLALDPRLNVRYALLPDWTLLAGVARVNQPPQEQRLDPKYGEPDLEPERGWHFGLGVEWQIDSALAVDLNGFLIRRTDLADRVNDTEATAGDGEDLEEIDVVRTRYANRGEGRSYGLELLLKRERRDGFYGWIAYTLSRSERRREPDEAFDIANNDQTHILTALASQEIGSGWEVGARFRLVSGNRRTPVAGATYDADDAEYEPVRGERNTDRQDLFHQLDLRIEKTWQFPAWRFSLYGDVQNVYNAENAEYTTYDYRYRDSASVQSTPIFPTLGIQGRF